MTVTSITPSSGSCHSTTDVVIAGTSFPVTITDITVDGVSASSIVRVSATQLTATFPAHADPGEVVVVVTGSGPVTANSTFTYIGGQWKVKRIDLKQRPEQSN